MSSVLRDLKRRKLFQWGAAYLAGAWLLLQVLDLVGDKFEWSGWVGRVGIVLLGVGFFAALVLAWYHGERGEQRVTTVELAMLAVLCVIASVGVAALGGTRDGAAAPQAEHSAPLPPASGAVEQRSIAVLPFVNMSGDPGQEYFSDGLSEELLNVLAKIPELHVAARTSSFSFKGQSVRVDSIGRALRVAHVLEGSVRKEGDRIRVTAQLVRADNGYHLWSDTYDRTLTGVFALQDEISRAIVQALQVRLSGAGPGGALAREETRDPEAYRLVLHGLHVSRQLHTKDGYARADSLLRQAVERDSLYARAWAGLAYTHYMQANRRLIEPRQGLERARREAERAVALAPHLDEGHAALGRIFTATYQWERAEASYRRALEVNPRSVDALRGHGLLLAQRGRTAEGIALARRAADLDPISLPVALTLSYLYRRAGQPEHALEEAERALQLDVTPIGLGFAAVALSDLDRHAEAIATAERMLQLAPDDPQARGTLADVYARAGRRAEAERHLQDYAATPGASPYVRASVYIALGERERGLALLEQAVRERDDNASGIRGDPAFTSVRGEPRFRRLLVQLGLD